MAGEMLFIRVRDVRPLVEAGQETLQLPEMGEPLNLALELDKRCRYWTSGRRGPEQRQRICRSSRPRKGFQLDRAEEPRWPERRRGVEHLPPPPDPMPAVLARGDLRRPWIRCWEVAIPSDLDRMLAQLVDQPLPEAAPEPQARAPLELEH